jgi:putative transposase
MIGPDWIRHLHAYIAGVVRRQGATCLAVGGVADHVHILGGLKSIHALADFVRELKRNSSIWAAERYHAFEWQIGYGAFSVSSRDVVGISAYIRNQEEHHRKVSSADELRSILDESGIAYDESYFE